MISYLRKAIFYLQSELRKNPNPKLFQALDIMSEVEIENCKNEKSEKNKNGSTINDR